MFEILVQLLYYIHSFKMHWGYYEYLLCFLPKFFNRITDISGACILAMPPGAWGREVKVIGSVKNCDVVSSKTLVFVCVYALHPN